MTNQSFIAQQEELYFYNAKAVINMAISFFYDDENFIITYINNQSLITNTKYPFTGYVSSYFRIYNDNQRDFLIKNFTTQITRNSNNLVLNLSVSDMTFNDLGEYFYEIGYSMNGYEVPIMYGKLKII